MIVYNYTPEGIYRDSEEAVESPLEKGVFLIPAGATSVKPPEVSEGFHAAWNGIEWIISPIPEPIVEPPAQELLIVEPEATDILNP
jgi:hypothetical protein